MFSGGRDSTLAAIRLSLTGVSLVLVTVSSSRLSRLENVVARLSELRGLLSPDTVWINLHQGDDSCPQSVLPLYQAYCALCLAREYGAKAVAFGYSGYQSSWPEQTPAAIEALEAFLEQQGLALVLPVQNLESKLQAIEELSLNGLSSHALEQKATSATSDAATSLSFDDIFRWKQDLSLLIEKNEPLHLVSRLTFSDEDLES